MPQHVTFVERFAKDKNCGENRDHCHYTGKYRGASHTICNLTFHVPNEIPLVFHNRSNKLRLPFYH